LDASTSPCAAAANRPRLHRPSADHRHPGTLRRPSRRRRAPHSGRHPTAGKPGLREQLSSDAVVLSDFAHLLAIPLRDGCDLLDVISRRLNADPS